jgi:hypothetical protein
VISADKISASALIDQFIRLQEQLPELIDRPARNQKQAEMDEILSQLTELVSRHSEQLKKRRVLAGSMSLLNSEKGKSDEQTS